MGINYTSVEFQLNTSQNHQARAQGNVHADQHQTTFYAYLKL